jgi:hypothetical protein
MKRTDFSRKGMIMNISRIMIFIYIYKKLNQLTDEHIILLEGSDSLKLGKVAISLPYNTIKNTTA